MSHISILSLPLPSITRRSEDNATYFQQASSSKQSLTVPLDSRLLRSSSNTNHPIDIKHTSPVAWAISLPASPISSGFPTRPAFRRAYTSTAASSISNSGESSRFDDLHYSQTHFSRSTLLVYPDSRSTYQAECECVVGETGEDIRELLASSDEESSAPHSTPAFDGAKIPPRGSSQLTRNKVSMESEKSTLSLPEPITILSPPGAKRNGYVPLPFPFHLFLCGIVTCKRSRA